MTEYKDAQAIIIEITKACDDCWHVQRIGDCPRDCFIKYAVKAVESVPAADVVPVVRCKDCKWWKNNDCKNDTHGYFPLDKNDFCSQGERKERDGNG